MNKLTYLYCALSIIIELIEYFWQNGWQRRLCILLGQVTTFKLKEKKKNPQLRIAVYAMLIKRAHPSCFKMPMKWKLFLRNYSIYPFKCLISRVDFMSAPQKGPKHHVTLADDLRLVPRMIETNLTWQLGI